MSNIRSGSPDPDLDVLVQKVVSALNLETDLAKAVLPVMLKNLQTLDRKQQDYGSQNLIKFGPFGVIVRMSDKLERLVNLFKKREKLKDAGAPNAEAFALNEPVADSFLDGGNYNYIAYVMEIGLWPKS